MIAMAKQRIALIFGGEENHERSCAAAREVISFLPSEFYEVVLIGVTKKGKPLFYPGDPAEVKEDVWERHPDCCACVFSADNTKRGIYKLLPDGTASFLSIDCAIPVLYTKNGTEGVLQGLLDAGRIPYTGSNLSAVNRSSDRFILKSILTASGLSVSDAAVFSRCDRSKVKEMVREIEERFSYPLQVSPARPRRMEGLLFVQNGEELENALKKAFVYDSRVMVEPLQGGVIVRCAVLGGEKAEASPLALLNEDHTISLNALPCSQEDAYRAREIALNAFSLLDCRGAALVTLLLMANGEIVIKEIEPCPDFMAGSDVYTLWESVGITGEDIFDRMIALAMERAEMQD